MWFDAQTAGLIGGILGGAMGVSLPLYFRFKNL